MPSVKQDQARAGDRISNKFQQLLDIYTHVEGHQIVSAQI